VSTRTRWVADAAGRCEVSCMVDAGMFSSLVLVDLESQMGNYSSNRLKQGNGRCGVWDEDICRTYQIVYRQQGYKLYTR